MTAPKLGNLVPYLFYADIEATMDWYVRVFGFVEKDRWRGPDGTVHNAEMVVGDTELWLNGGGRERMPDRHWVGVWLATPADVDAMYDHIVAAGVAPEAAPVDRPFGVRTFSVTDPEGYQWGFMARIARTDQQ